MVKRTHRRRKPDSNASGRFEAQVGVANGLVVGDLIGAGAALQDSVVGSAPAKPAALDAATAR